MKLSKAIDKLITLKTEVYRNAIKNEKSPNEMKSNQDYLQFGKGEAYSHIWYELEKSVKDFLWIEEDKRLMKYMFPIVTFCLGALATAYFLTKAYNIPIYF